ncbi:hypothetical protein GCM10025870_27160 [Agromyces marinus]|uniref:Uncharacterized protein n=1 Tax=Agromyces marinus TaxID=1389020 RepID=A0ABM8H4B4_9MICO|nr:hypothetical protein [Agromyces marinus]BDZ55643.1 hypothetical protein GCM10025870_27160 [Agromyces marinus]
MAAHGSRLTLTLTGIPGAEVELLADGVPFLTVTLDASGTRVVELHAPGNHRWTAGARYA